MTYSNTSNIIILILVGCLCSTFIISSGMTASAPSSPTTTTSTCSKVETVLKEERRTREGGMEEGNGRENKTETRSQADDELPGVVDNLILMTSNQGSGDENKIPGLTLPKAVRDNSTHIRVKRKDRFYYCGPKNEKNYCRSLCYAMGYPTYVCGRISCYCTF